MNRHALCAFLAIALLLALGPFAAAGAAQGSAAPLASPPHGDGREPEGESTADVAMLYVDEVTPGQPGPYLPYGQAFVDESEPNDTAATADALTSNSVAWANIFPTGDVDYFSFTANAGDRVYAATMTSGSASSSDSTLQLIASDGVTVLEQDLDDGSMGSTSSTIAGATVPSAGTYYLRVVQGSGTSQIRFYHLHLRVQSGSPTAEAEPNNTTATANPLPASGWITGTRSTTSDVDYYSLPLSAGDTVYLSLDLDPERDGITWNGSVGLGVFGNFILMVDDPSSTSPNSEAGFYTVQQGGTYYVQVTALATTGLLTGTYNLSVSVRPPEAQTCTTYMSTDVGQVIGPGAGIVTSTLTIPGNPRIGDLDVTLNLTHSMMVDLDVHLVSPNGQNIGGLFDDVGAGSYWASLVTMTLELDDEAAMPIWTYSVLYGTNRQLEQYYRLAWFDGQDAGGTWSLVLADDATNTYGGRLLGWGLRVCEPPPPPTCPPGTVQQAVYAADFEADGGGFTHSGVQDEWARGQPSYVPITSCNSGVNCWKTDLTGTYNAGSNQDLRSPAINTAGYIAPFWVQWAQKYQMENATYDHAYALVRQAGGANPRKLWEWLDYTMTSSQGNPTVVYPESGGWGQRWRDISEYGGQSVELLYHLDSDGTGQYGGLAIDDVAVYGCRPAAGADVWISKTDTPDPVYKGSPLTYTLTVNNAGPDPAANVLVTDTLPPGYAAVSVTPSSGSCALAGQQIACSLGTLAMGEAPTITVLGAPMGSVPCASVLRNTALVSTSTADYNLVNNTTLQDTSVICQESCTTYVSTDVPYPIPDANTVTGVTSTLTIPTAGTISDVNVVGLWISHTWDADLDIYMRSPTNPTLLDLSTDNGGSGDNYLNTMLDDEAATSITAGVAPFTGSYRPEQPLSTYDGADQQGTWMLRVFDDTAGDTGRLNGWGLQVCNPLEPALAADTAIVKAATPDPVTAGQLLTYTLAVNNAGPNIATNVVVTDALSSDLVFVSAASTLGTCAYGAPVVTCDLGNLAAGSNAAITVVTRVNPEAQCPQSLPNSAYVANDTGDPNAGNDVSSTATQMICAASDLSIVKSDSADPVTVGDVLTYTVVVTNNGPDVATNVVFSDTLPAAFTFAGGSITSGSCVVPGGTVVCTDTSLASGGTITLQLWGTVDAPSCPGTLSNSVVVTSDIGDPNLGNNSDIETTAFVCAPTPVIAVDPMSFALTVTLGYYNPVVQTMTISNTGTANLNWQIVEAPSACAVPGDIPWLSAAPITGTIAPGGSTPVNVTFDNMAAMPVGVYSGTLCVNSNDPVNPQLALPVTLTIRAPTAVTVTGLTSSAMGSLLWLLVLVPPAAVALALHLRRRR